MNVVFESDTIILKTPFRCVVLFTVLVSITRVEEILVIHYNYDNIKRIQVTS